MVRNPPANAGDIRDADLTPGSGRFPGGGNGNLLQHSCLENSMDRGAWRARPWGRKELNTTEQIAHTHIMQSLVGGWPHGTCFDLPDTAG